MPLDPKVNFFFLGCKPTLRDRLSLKGFIISIFKREKRLLDSISFVFTKDKLLHELNTNYLNHDYYTDIITFELSEKNRPIIADVYISCDRVQENAKIHNNSFKEELHRVIFHGVLHLCGYKDKAPNQSKKMRGKENYYLRRYLA